MTNLLKQDHVLLILHKYLRELIGVFNMYANLDGLTAIKGTQTATKKSDGDAIADKLNSYEAKEHEALDEKATMTLRICKFDERRSSAGTPPNPPCFCTGTAGRGPWR